MGHSRKTKGGYWNTTVDGEVKSHLQPPFGWCEKNLVNHGDILPTSTGEFAGFLNLTTVVSLPGTFAPGNEWLESVGIWIRLPLGAFRPIFSGTKNCFRACNFVPF